MKITGFINTPTAAPQPLNATAQVFSGVSLGLSLNNVVRIYFENLSILKTVRVKSIHLIAPAYNVNLTLSGNTLKPLERSGEYFNFDTDYPAADYANNSFIARVMYEMDLEDLLLLIYFALRNTAKVLNKGCKLVSPNPGNLDYPSFIQNLGTTDQTLVYSDCYGNTGTFILKPGEATYFLVSIVNTGSGDTLYQLYTM